MKRIILALLSCFPILLFSQKEAITIDELTEGRYVGQRMHRTAPITDGLRWAEMTPDGKKIIARSFQTGKQVGVLFDVSDLKGIKLQSIEGFILSPDERHILLRTNTKQIYRHSRTAEYYTYSVQTKRVAKLSEGGPQECPVWSPDGWMVAFVRDNNIFLVKLLYDNSESQVTTDGNRNSIINGKPDWVNEEEFANDCALVFTSDSKMICWIRYDETDVKPFAIPGLEYKYPFAGEQNSTVTVHSYDIKSHQTRKLKSPVERDGYIPRIFATSNPDKLCIVTTNKHQDRMDIFMVSPRSTEATLILRDEVKPYIGENAYQQMHFFNGGFAMTSERNGWNHIYVYDLNGRLRRQATTGEWQVTDFYGVDPRTQTVYFASTQEGPTTRTVAKADASGKVTKLSTQRGTNQATFSKTFAYFINAHSTLQSPWTITTCDANGRTLKTLEDNSDLCKLLATKSLGTKEFFSFATSNGTQLNGYMVKPAGFSSSQRYPVVMFQYSGPGSQQVLDSWSAGNMGGCAYEQYLAQQGFVCVCVDGRGTGGRGANFEKQTYLRLGQMEAEDQVETALWLAQQPYVDADRIGIWGWSYGGFMTLMAMSEGRGAFKAGVAVAPPTSWRFYDTAYTERFMRTPKENPDGYADGPIARAAKLEGALLICHGLADDNVHFRNTAEYTDALIEANKDYRMLVYNGRSHGISGGNARKHLFTQITNWFKTELR